MNKTFYDFVVIDIRDNSIVKFFNNYLDLMYFQDSKKWLQDFYRTFRKWSVWDNYH